MICNNCMKDCSNLIGWSACEYLCIACYTAKCDNNDIKKLHKDIEACQQKIAELEGTIDFYKKSMERVANLFDVTSPFQLIARAENDEETLVDILIKVAKQDFDITKKK